MKYVVENDNSDTRTVAMEFDMEEGFTDAFKEFVADAVYEAATADYYTFINRGSLDAPHATANQEATIKQLLSVTNNTLKDMLYQQCREATRKVISEALDKAQAPDEVKRECMRKLDNPGAGQ